MVWFDMESTFPPLGTDLHELSPGGRAGVHAGPDPKTTGKFLCQLLNRVLLQAGKRSIKQLIIVL